MILVDQTISDFQSYTDVDVLRPPASTGNWAIPVNRGAPPRRSKLINLKGQKTWHSGRVKTVFK